MMDDILPSFKEKVAEYQLNAPSIPYISNVTGTWIDHEAVQDPAYWADHLRQAVRFRDGAETLLTELDPIFVEVGLGEYVKCLYSPSLKGTPSAADSIDASPERRGSRRPLPAGQAW